MALFDKVSSALGLGGQDIGAVGEQAFRVEQERLRKLRKTSREESAFLETEGKGVSEKADVTFGDQLDLEDLTDEERLQRSSGRIDTPNTGLIL